MNMVSACAFLFLWEHHLMVALPHKKFNLLLFLRLPFILWRERWKTFTVELSFSGNEWQLFIFLHFLLMEIVRIPAFSPGRLSSVGCHPKF